MSLSSVWRRLRARMSSKSSRRPLGEVDAAMGAGREPAQALPVEQTLDPDEQVLSDWDGSDAQAIERAVAAFENLARRGGEDAALGRVLELHRRETCPTELACAAARLLLQRKEPELARRLLEGERSAEALVLLADAAVARGHTADAVELAERALAYDFDSAGARERLQSWQGDTNNQAVVSNQPTLLSKDLPETSLRIVAEVGRGGAATVYRARDDVLGRDLALKVYHRPEFDRDKLVREARMAVTLAMRGVVHIFDVDPEHGWIAMEYAERGALGEASSAGKVNQVHPAHGWFRDLTQVVARIHERGFVHADLKPANVLLKGPSEVLVSDFGLALPFGGAHLGASAGYVSPERHAGAPASAADDVFSLGRILARVLALLGEGAPDRQRWHELAEQLTARERPRDAGEVLPLVPEGQRR